MNWYWCWHEWSKWKTTRRVRVHYALIDRAAVKDDEHPATFLRIEQERECGKCGLLTIRKRDDLT